MNFLNVSEIYIDRIHKVYHLIKNKIPQAQIYLFGSYAKRKIKTSSDMDILVLMNTDCSKLELKQLKWDLEEQIEEETQFEYEVDLKIYTTEHFNKSKQHIGFEHEISRYMIRLEDELWM